MTEHAWFPQTTCDTQCVGVGSGSAVEPIRATVRAVLRLAVALPMLSVLPLLTLPLPGRDRMLRTYCRLMLTCLGVRVAVSGDPIRNLSGVLVVSNHVSWADIFAVGSLYPGAFVARADVVNWPAIGLLARMADVIPIDRTSLRRLPAVVGAVTRRLEAGATVVAFPEGTTWCGLADGPFRPALFQAAVDARRPVQPLRLTYHHDDGRPSTVTAFLGTDPLRASLFRTARERRTIVRVEVGALQLPGASRRDLSSRCESALRGPRVQHV